LAELAERGNETALVKVLRLAENESAAVRSTAIVALLQVGPKSDPRVTQVVTNFLLDKDEGVKQAALPAFDQLAEPGSKKAVDIVVNALHHEDDAIREQVIKVLPRVIGPSSGAGYGHAVELLTQRLRHKKARVRSAAVDALATFVEKDDRRCLKAVCGCLNHKDSVVRYSALKALPHIALMGDPTAISGIGGCLADAEEAVAVAAIEALHKLAPVGNEEAIRVLSKLLADSNSDVRRAAVDVFAVLGKGSISAICEAGRHMQSQFWTVRWNAVEAMCSVAEKGDSRAIALLRSLQKHRLQRVRDVAAYALALVDPQTSQQHGALRTDIVTAAFNCASGFAATDEYSLAGAAQDELTDMSTLSEFMSRRGINMKCVEPLARSPAKSKHAIQTTIDAEEASPPPKRRKLNSSPMVISP